MDNKRTGISFNFNDDAELFAALNEYRQNMGITWKRMCLLGIAETIARSGENKDLAIAIANYITGKKNG